VIVLKRFLFVLFTVATFFYSSEIQATYGRILNSEPVSHYLEITESFITKTGLESFLQKTLQQKHILVSLGNLAMPVESDLKVQVTEQITLAAGDTGIDEKALKNDSAIINEISLPILKSKLNLVPVNKVSIILYSTPEYYGQALIRAGISPSEIPAIVQSTGGLTVNSSIWIPLYNLNGKGDLTNALTHELTHVALNQAGISGKLPLWLNEGTAWFTGLAANEVVNPTQAKIQSVAIKQSVEKLAKKGELLPLNSLEQKNQISYNLEAEGYLATEALIKKYGLETFKEFLNQTSHQDVNRSFSSNFKISINDYEKSFKP
jgi:hypothetical protein